MSEATETTKKQRTPRPIAVEALLVQKDDIARWIEQSRCTTISEAEKWIKAMGKEDTTYRIITIEKELVLAVTMKRVASFA